MKTRLLKVRKIPKRFVVLFLILLIPMLYLGSIGWISIANSRSSSLWDRMESHAQQYKLTTRFSQQPDPVSLVRFDDLSQPIRTAVGLDSHMQGYQNLDGEVVIPPIYQFASNEFNEGLAFVGTKNRKGYIRPDGSWAFDANFTYCDEFVNGRARVRRVPWGSIRWRAGFIDPEGKVAVALKYNTVGEFVGPYTIVGEPTMYANIWESLMDGIDISIGPFDFLFPPSRLRFIDKDGNIVPARKLRQWMRDYEKDQE